LSITPVRKNSSKKPKINENKIGLHRSKSALPDEIKTTPTKIIDFGDFANSVAVSEFKIGLKDLKGGSTKKYIKLNNDPSLDILNSTKNASGQGGIRTVDTTAHEVHVLNLSTKHKEKELSSRLFEKRSSTSPMVCKQFQNAFEQAENLRNSLYEQVSQVFLLKFT